MKYKTHVDTVLAYREHYLNSIGSKESLQKFQQFSGKVCEYLCSVCGWVMVLCRTVLFHSYEIKLIMSFLIQDRGCLSV